MSALPAQHVNQFPLPEAVGYVHLQYKAETMARLDKLSGWAFFQDQRYSVDSIDDLPDNHLWISNLEWVEHQALVGSKYPNIKSSRFLPLSLGQIRNELALNSVDDEEFAKVLVALSNNLLRLCVEAYDQTLLPALLEHQTFAQAISAVIGMNENKQPNTNDELHTKIIWDNVFESTVLTEVDPKLPLACFRVPMWKHTEKVMQCPLPSDHGPWIEVHVPPSNLDDFFARDEVPSIVEITEIKLPTALEAVYPAKAGTRYQHKKFWLPSIEAAFLRSIGHIEIGRVFLQPLGYQKNTTWSQKVPAVSGRLQLSYSAQMMSHAHMLSAASPLSQSYWPIHAWWVRSMDRQLLMFSVMALASIDGIAIQSFGEGCVFLQGSPMSVSKAIEAAPRMGLVPTASAWRAGDPEMNKEITQMEGWLTEDFTVFEKTAVQLGNREIGLLLKLDEAALLALSSEELADQAITQILRGIKHGRSF